MIETIEKERLLVPKFISYTEEDQPDGLLADSDFLTWQAWDDSMDESRDIPFGVQFSPEQVDLAEVLEIVVDHSGDAEAMEKEFYDRYFRKDTDPLSDEIADWKAARYQMRHDYPRVKVANNTYLSIRDYELIDRDDCATPLAKRLHQIRNNQDKLYEEFAKHILLNLNGQRIVEIVRDTWSAGEKPTLENLPKAFEERGLKWPKGGMHFSSLRGWLNKAGIIPNTTGSPEVNVARMEEIIGIQDDQIQALSAFDRTERAFLRALSRFPEQEWTPSNSVRDMAEALYDVRFPQKSLPRVLAPLENAGFVEMRKTTKGRGAKPHEVRGTEKFKADVVDPLLSQFERGISGLPRRFLTMTLEEILEKLQVDDRHEKGLALEALALYLARLLDLKFYRWRERSRDTGGAEVDLIVESDRLVYSRWQVQCKNVSSVGLGPVAKEVGLTFQTKANVVLIVTTGRITNDAREYATRVMESTNLVIGFLTKGDLNKIQQSPDSIVNVLTRQAKEVMKIKRRGMKDE